MKLSLKVLSMNSMEDPCPYTPDFKINHFVNGFQFLEIKPIEKTNDPDFIERFKAQGGIVLC
jgi:hypothetical protein